MSLVPNFGNTLENLYVLIINAEGKLISGLNPTHMKRVICLIGNTKGRFNIVVS